MHYPLSRRRARRMADSRSASGVVAIVALLSAAACQDPAAPPVAKLSPPTSPNFAVSADTMDIAFATPVAPQGEIAFASDRSGTLDIYVLDVATGRTHRLTRDRGEEKTPTWSPDGSKIAFSSSRDGRTDIYVMNADGTGVTRATRSSGNDRTPAWQP